MTTRKQITEYFIQSFEVEKEEMYVENDTTNGKKYLVPPKLSPVFVPDAVLVKTTKGVSS